MSLWPVTVTLDGVALELDDVLADVSIHHGREQLVDEPTATSCQLTIRNVGAGVARDFRVGVSLVVTAEDAGRASLSVPRFTGRVTDAALDVDELTVVAVGRLATLGQYAIGASSWPAEPWSARVRRLFTEAGLDAILDLQADASFDPVLAPRDPATAGETTLGDYLAYVAPMVGAAVTDRPDGLILVQAIGARSLEGYLALDPADVAYAPAWEQVLPAGNIVTVRYTGDQSESVTITDQASVDHYGRRPRTIDTSFVELADATTRATEALARGAWSRWQIPEAPILRPLELTIGEPVEISAMPEASPFDPWTPIVEGWTDTITRDEWTMRLALSDPLASGLGLPWNIVPAGELWTTIDQLIPWRDAVALADLVGA